MKIEILGPGCMKCNELYQSALKAVSEAGVDAEVIKIEDIREIMNRGIMMTPGLIIDGNVKSTGKVLSVEEIKKLIT